MPLPTITDSIKCLLNNDAEAESQHNIHDIYRNHLSHMSMVSKHMHLPYSLMIYNCHGDFNVGALSRTGCCLGASAVYTVGRRKLDRRTLVGSQNYMSFKRLDALNPDPVTWFKEHNMFPVFIEQGGTDISECDFRTLWKRPEMPCLVVGSECDGLPESFIRSFPNSPRLSIGQPGVIRSLNVGSAGAMAMERMYYAWRLDVINRYGLD